MGLDLVELVIRIEETFGIAIPDRVAGGLTTPRKVTDFILSQVDESVDENQAALSCMSQRAFYLLRREFMRQLSLSREEFVVHAKFEELLPEDRRDEVWKNIGSSLCVRTWPAVSRSAWYLFRTPSVQSVNELVDYFVTNEPLIVKGNETEWSRQQVWDVLQRLIKDETSVTDFSEDSRFVEDMDLD
jgi:hypothetical protein